MRRSSTIQRPADGEQPVRFAGSVLGEKRHICAFFNSPEDGVSDLLEYEARFNLVPCHQHPVICTYDIGKFRGDVPDGRPADSPDDHPGRHPSGEPFLRPAGPVRARVAGARGSTPGLLDMAQAGRRKRGDPASAWLHQRSDQHRGAARSLERPRAFPDRYHAARRAGPDVAPGLCLCPAKRWRSTVHPPNCSGWINDAIPPFTCARSGSLSRAG